MYKKDVVKTLKMPIALYPVIHQEFILKENQQKVKPVYILRNIQNHKTW